MAHTESSPNTPSPITLETIYHRLGILARTRTTPDQELAGKYAAAVTEMFHEAVGPFGGGIHIHTLPHKATSLPRSMEAIEYRMMFTGRAGTPQANYEWTLGQANKARYRALQLWGSPEEPGQYLHDFFDLVAATRPNENLHGLRLSARVGHLLITKPTTPPTPPRPGKSRKAA